MSTDRTHGSPTSHLFTVRIWEEEMGPEQTELRGKVQLLTTGETRYFREWAQLVPLLRMMLAELHYEPEAQQ